MKGTIMLIASCVIIGFATQVGTTLAQRALNSNGKHGTMLGKIKDAGIAVKNVFKNKKEN